MLRKTKIRATNKLTLFSIFWLARRRAMLEGGMREANQTTVRLEEVRHEIFLKLIQFLYTDECEIHLDIAMELFQAADQFGVERLKKMCEVSERSAGGGLRKMSNIYESQLN